MNINSHAVYIIHANSIKDEFHLEIESLVKSEDVKTLKRESTSTVYSYSYASIIQLMLDIIDLDFIDYKAVITENDTPNNDLMELIEKSLSEKQMLFSVVEDNVFYTDNSMNQLIFDKYSDFVSLESNLDLFDYELWKIVKEEPCVQFCEVCKEGILQVKQNNNGIYQFICLGCGYTE